MGPNTARITGYSDSQHPRAVREPGQEKGLTGFVKHPKTPEGRLQNGFREVEPAIGPILPDVLIEPEKPLTQSIDCYVMLVRLDCPDHRREAGLCGGQMYQVPHPVLRIGLRRQERTIGMAGPDEIQDPHRVALNPEPPARQGQRQGMRRPPEPSGRVSSPCFDLAAPAWGAARSGRTAKSADASL